MKLYMMISLIILSTVIFATKKIDWLIYIKPGENERHGVSFTIGSSLEYIF